MPMPDKPVLSLDKSERDLAARLLASFLDDYEHSIPGRRILPVIDRAALESLLTTPFPDKGIGVEGVFREINEKILPNSTTVSHPRFLAYVIGPPNGIAPYAEAIAAAINQNCVIWRGGPAASVIERAVVAWLGGLFGYDDDAGGILTPGGSIAILGIGLDNVRRIPVDDQYRMRTDALAEAIRADREHGFEPFCVVATPGTVTTGAIDPIADIADVCEREHLWLHLDGAYGGLFVLSDRKREAFQACARADSVAVDPHKLLFAPLEAGCLLLRDRTTLTRAFAFRPSVGVADKDPLMPDYMDYGQQLSRGFRALKLWTALQAFGVDAFRSAIDQTLDLARYLAELIEQDPGLELMAPAPLTAVCFRIKNATEADHAAALIRLLEEGTAFLIPAYVNGRPGIRACITNYRTTHADIDLIVAQLSHIARQLSTCSPGPGRDGSSGVSCR